MLLAERFPALELRQLLRQAAQPLHRRLRQQAGAGLARPDLVGGGARSLQLAGGERLLRGVQQGVHVLPRSIGFLFRRVDLREPPLLDHDQRGFEAPRQRGRAHAAIQRLPAFRQLRVVDRRARGELLGFDDERLGAGQRVELLRPALDPLLGLVEPRQRRGIGGLAASSRNAANSCADRSKPSDVAGGSAFRAIRSSRRSNRARARCSSCSRSKRACSAWRAASQRARRAGSPPRSSACQRRLSSITAVRIGPGLVASASSCARIASASAASPSRSAIASIRFRASRATPRSLFLGGVGELAQSLGRVHALGGGHARFRMLGGERELDQRGFVADRGDRAAATLRILCAARHVGADRIGARSASRNAVAPAPSGVSREQVPSAAASAARTAGSVSFSQARGERAEVGAAVRRGEADLRRGIAARSAASSSDSGGNSATATRRAGSA